ncbi:MAG: VCBS repeat-containing protein [Planctomycetes bacterium]|nr:VCBS repeat-containing protein [Planctomycetota bacterium]
MTRALFTAALLALAAPAQTPDFAGRWVGFDTSFDTDAKWPWAVRFGDVDFDADLDALIVTGGSIPRLSLLKNRGRGIFEAPRHFATPATTWDDIVDLELADFDRDGDLDVAIANFGNVGTSSRVFVHRNDGTGNFSVRQSFPTGAGPTGIAVADFDGDGWIDIATANYGRIAAGNTVSILRNNGVGGFAAPQHLSVGAAPYRLSAADLDGDGRPDLAVAREQQQLAILLNRTTGWTTTSYPMLPNGYAGDAYPCVELVDLDRDGDRDAAFTSTKAGYNPTPGSGAVLIATNDGQGRFGAPVPLLTGNFTQGGVDLCSGDFNLDGWNDLASTHLWNGEFEIFLSDGQGGFQPYLLRSSGEQTIAIQAQDFEPDGRMDLVLLDRNCLSLAVHRNDGTGRFEGSDPQRVLPSGTGARFARADFDGDTIDDLALSFAVGSTAGGVQLLRGSAQGLQPLGTVVGFTTVSALAAVDVDLDGWIDLLFADERAPYAWNYARNVGGGAFAMPLSFPGFGSRIGGIAAHDFDVDGDIDVALGYAGTGSTSAGAYVAWNQGAAVFSAVQRFPLTWGLTRLLAEDMNNDGRPDLVANSSTSAIEVLLSRPGGFAAARSHTVGGGVADLVVGDWNRDAILDIATSNREAGLTHSSLSMALGRGDGTFLTSVTQRSAYHIQYFNAAQLVALDVDRDGDLDLAQGHTESRDVSLFRNGGNGVFTRDARYGIGWHVRDLIGGDFDADGFEDLVAGVDTSRTPFGITHTVHIRGNGGQPWFTLGFGLPGSLGVPYLEGLPPFEAPRPARLQLWLARPASPALLVIGSTRWNVPFAGGAMVPAYELAFPFVTNAAGAASFNFPFPGYARQRFEIYAQAWILDPTAPQGMAASEGLVGLAN